MPKFVHRLLSSNSGGLPFFSGAGDTPTPAGSIWRNGRGRWTSAGGEAAAALPKPRGWRMVMGWRWRRGQSKRVVRRQRAVVADPAAGNRRRQGRRGGGTSSSLPRGQREGGGGGGGGLADAVDPFRPVGKAGSGAVG
uniref:Uncharacterized protein n=1 Tax=Oryza sativa subsp. japonica TaxID=39947 RepID=Q53ND0_ORYSJ|nr:hypothetical protein [Oryza sativa Japonica Group]